MSSRSLKIGLALIVIGLIGILATHILFYYYAPTARRYPFKTRLKGPQEEGRRIYYTGRNINGERIPFTLPDGGWGMHGRRGPGMMRNRSLGCVDCHGESGRGGLNFPDDKVSADIRWSALKKMGYNFDKFKDAVTEGIDEDGETLSRFMPRWQMTDQELESLKRYLETL